MPTWHSKGREEPGMVLSRGRSIISLPESLWERSTKRECVRRFLTATRKMKYFHASQLQHNWTKEWFEYLDYYITTTDIPHNALPEQLERYATLSHFRKNPKQMEKGPMKSRPDYQKTTRAIVSMNKEAG